MKISILCTSIEHPVFERLVAWKNKHNLNYDIELVHSTQDLTGGDILFLISCNELIKKDVLNQYKSILVIHASDLPEGKGWSPHIWQIIEGKNNIIVTLLEAEDKVDSGLIWTQRKLILYGHELYDEINEKLFAIEIDLMDFAVENFKNISPMPQREVDATFYRKRTSEDSRIVPEKSIAEQFDLLRVADTHRFPAFFDFRGYRYQIELKKLSYSHD